MNDIELVKIIEELIFNKKSIIVGIDGPSGAGKSTISQKILMDLKNKDYSVCLLHIDDFIHPKAVRYNDDYPQWQCFYNLQWRFDYFREVINNLKSESGLQSLELYDKENDDYYIEDFDMCSPDIVIVEGVFLQRKETRDLFDYIIYLDLSRKIRLQRVAERDKYIGSKGQIMDKYEKRYLPAEDYYINEYKPVENADYVIRG